ncbi:hypothetical protein [Meridianimaribacter flavus]|uniref:Adhesin domain-containing protein n=1 Tax=Meridianimaribacter flavus TaxID=571115 RepID=A0ABY2G6H8_9FLAO|nr:hypothetical protein [Meridianimaribacter flavus]TDY11747.1 hypothetical protein A8975_1586 [Meridianimaribacter flavus]
MKTIQLMLFMLCATISVTAQQQLNKISQSIKVDKDVTIDLNTSYVQIEIDTWNKDLVEVEAYIESDKLSKEELKKALENWNISVEGSGKNVSISSKGSRNVWGNFNMEGFEFEFDNNFEFDALRELEFELAELPEMPELPEIPELPEMPEMELPKLPKLPKLPELPKGIHSVHFDTEAYKKDGEKYLEKWSKEYEEKYGKEYKDKMKAWAKEFSKVDFDNYEKEMQKWGEEYGKQFGEDYEVKLKEWSKKFDKQWGKEYAKRMEEWEAKHGKQMEERAKQMEERSAEIAKRFEERQKAHAERQAHLAERLEERMERNEKRRVELSRTLEARSGKVKKTIKIKMPKDAKLNLNVRHGELKFTSVIKNLRADISHSTLVANHIDGSETSINVSYSPVLIDTWSQGELKLNYVDKAHVKQVNRIVLNSNSSNISLDNLNGNAIIDGSFGDLTISKINDSFNNINLVLENSDALISLPKTAFNLQYKGDRTRFTHPEKQDAKNTSSFSTNSPNSNKTIVVNAKFSHVIMQ